MTDQSNGNGNGGKFAAAVNNVIVLALVRIAVPVGFSVCGWLAVQAIGAFNDQGHKLDAAILQSTSSEASIAATLNGQEQQLRDHGARIRSLENEMQTKADRTK